MLLALPKVTVSQSQLGPVKRPTPATWSLMIKKKFEKPKCKILGKFNIHVGIVLVDSQSVVALPSLLALCHSSFG